VAYIGRPSIVGNFVKLDSITAVNGQAAYTMQNNSVNFTDYSTVNQFMVSLNSVVQSPGSSFTVSGSTITFASNLVTGDVIDFIIVFGNSLSAGVPTDATVTTAKLADSAVTAAKITDSTITAAKLASGTVQNQSAFKNIIINGDMSIAQRGTSVSSISSGTAYDTVDRFSRNIGSAGTWTISQSTDVPTGQGFAKSLKMDCTTANGSLSSNSEFVLRQNVEGQNLQYLKKGTSSAESTTLSFWVKSNKTGTYICELVDNDNSRQISQAYTISSADTWEKKTLTFDGDTTGAFGNDNGNSLTVGWWLVAGSDFTSGTLSTTWTSSTNANRVVGQVNLADSTSNEWYITGVQLEAGTSASDFEFLPQDVNKQRCFRYYYRSVVESNGIGFFCSMSNAALACVHQFPAIMRAVPTMGYGWTSAYTGNTWVDLITGGVATWTLTQNQVGREGVKNIYDNSKSGYTVGRHFGTHMEADAEL